MPSRLRQRKVVKGQKMAPSNGIVWCWCFTPFAKDFLKRGSVMTILLECDKEKMLAINESLLAQYDGDQITF